MKVKINHTLFITLSLITLLIAGNYWGIAQFVLPYKARLYILVLSGAIPLLLPLYYKKRSIIIPMLLIQKSRRLLKQSVGMPSVKASPVGIFSLYPEVGDQLNHG